MPRGTHLDSNEKCMIDYLKSKNQSIRKIAEEINRSKTLVANYLKDPSKYGTVKRSGRRPKLSARNLRTIKKVSSNASISASTIAHDFDLKVSPRTINRARAACSTLDYQKMRSTPPLDSVRKAKRLQWAKQHMTWNLEWSQIVWSDEKKFNLDGPDGYSYYWHDLRKEKIFSTRRNMGGGGLMLWGSFGQHGKSDLVFIEGKMNAAKYRKVLQEHLVHIGQKIGGPLWVFQQDNAPIHRANVNHTWFQTKGIRVLEWPSYSPDLNPMENIWASLSRRVYSEGKQYNNKEDLKKAILTSWKKISIFECRNLINSMPNRLFELIKVNGAKTKY